MSHLGSDASQAIAQNQRQLAEKTLELIYLRLPELDETYGKEGREKGLQDLLYHLSYLSEALAASDPSLFVDYSAWVKVLLEGLNMPRSHLITTYTCLEETLVESLPAEMQALVSEYVRAGTVAMEKKSAELPSFIDQGTALGPLASQYLDALLQGDRHTASRLILDAVESGTDVKGIYLDVFQTSQREIGRLWQTNQVSVAQEHFCTAATQLIMSQLYPYIFSTERADRRLVASCVGGELHEIGVRMVADFFEMDGWDTYYLGANTPAESILRAIEERQADVLGISATMTYHIKLVGQLIEEVRKSDAGKGVKILVGGYPFNVAAALWKEIGADGYAPNAQAAIAEANQLALQG